MELLDRLRGEAEVHDGALKLSGLELTWAASGLDVVRPNTPPEHLSEGDFAAIQLSGSKRRRAPNWVQRLLKRRPSWEALLHAEIRSCRGLRLRFHAVLPNLSVLAELPHLEQQESPCVPLPELSALLETTVALGARLAEAHASLLHAPEALQRTRLEQVYEVDSQLVYIPFAEVGEVSAMEPHDNADRLEVARVAGLTFVVQKDTRKRGDRVVYLPVGIELPANVAEALGIRHYLKKGKTVRKVNLRGVDSQGLLLDLNKDIDALTKLGAVVFGRRARIDAVEPHPKSKNHDVILVDGRTCVVTKGTWTPGAAVLFFPSGSRLPGIIAAQLQLESYLGRGNRVRNKPFKGTDSEGLLVADRL